MSNLSRANALKIAAAISFLMGLVAVVAAILFIQNGDVGDSAPDAPPYFVMVAALVFGILRLMGAYGTWRQQRWGILLTLFANAIDGVLAVPGILFAPTTGLQISAIITVVAAIVITGLCLWRDRRPAIA